MSAMHLPAIDLSRLDRPVPNTSGIHPALRSFADEVGAVAVRLLAYVCGLAALAVIVVDLLSAAPAVVSPAAPIAPGWTPASRPHPAFAISRLDLSDRTDSYEILRHPEGGRRDILRWASRTDGSPDTEIEIYRPGNELEAFSSAEAAVAARMSGRAQNETEPAGVIDSKFGPVSLFRLSGASDRRACLGFAKSFEAPSVRISGWSCQGGTPSARQALLGCMLNRLMLLSAGNDPKMAELFAHAELRRHSCNMAAATPAANHWLTTGDAPQLRGPLAN